jgi:general stress protein 26
MATKNSPDDDRRKLHEIVGKARAVMLLTQGPDQAIDGRPMSIVTQDEDGTLYLVTSVDSQTADELSKQPKASLSMSSSAGFAMIHADIRVSQDRSLIDELWQDSWRAWFPDGKTDTSIAVLIAHPIDARYWEQELGKGVSYFYRFATPQAAGARR